MWPIWQHFQVREWFSNSWKELHACDTRWRSVVFSWKGVKASHLNFSKSRSQPRAKPSQGVGTRLTPIAKPSPGSKKVTLFKLSGERIVGLVERWCSGVFKSFLKLSQAMSGDRLTPKAKPTPSKKPSWWKHSWSGGEVMHWRLSKFTQNLSKFPGAKPSQGLTTC